MKNKHKAFWDLAPSQNAEGIDEYFEAIEFALSSSQIKNIAITGPYGSGKSSIIRTYEKTQNKATHEFLNISLATFIDEEFELKGSDTLNRKPDTKFTDSIEKQNRLIEQSILQQMLYGTDSQKLPYSRFQRISKPYNSTLKAILIIFWATFFYLLSNNATILLKFDYSSSWWQWSIISLLFLILSVLFVAELLKFAFRTPLKKFSLSSGELETADLPEGSILNKYLDEIIYFFQETKYTVVVIEDLDRFGSTDIFIKLREINKLINDNLVGCASKDKPARIVKFIYALKDDMFLHKDRTKFFDFIIPVVPVVNSSNSLDKIEERISGQPYESHFKVDSNRQFLRDVSFRLDDLRLIHNIFNEFNIYYSKLKSESLNITKLLAMMIYKNVYPSDFEALHFRKGALALLCDMKTSLLATRKAELQRKLSDLRTRLHNAEQEKARSLQELIDAYIGRMVSYSPVPVIGIVANGNLLQFSRIKSTEQLEALFQDQNIHLATEVNFNQYNRNHLKQSINKSFSAIESEINPGMTFKDRVKAIETRPATEQLIIKNGIKKLEQEIATLPLQPLSKLIVDNISELDKPLSELSPQDPSVFTYLVKNGYLDDSYHLYTSNFYAGRLSPRDREFIIAASNLAGALPSEFQIDTPEEIVQNLGNQHFNSPYILNVQLIDYLVSVTSSKSQTVFRYIAEYYGDTQLFLQSYLQNGQRVDQFIVSLFKSHPNIIKTVCGSSLGADIVSYILRFLDDDFIVEQLNEENVLTRFLSDNGEKVFVAQSIRPDRYSSLIALGVKFNNLSELKNNSDLLSYCYENSLYSISANNILFLLNHFASRLKYPVVDIERSNYTSIIGSQEKTLSNYIDRNIVTYISNVFLQMVDNNEESEEVIIELLRNSSIELKMKEQILKSQKHIFKLLTLLPAEMWTYSLSEKHVEISWANIASYKAFEECDVSLLTRLLNDEQNRISLTSNSFSESEVEEEYKLELFQFIAENEVIMDVHYKKYMEYMPFEYTAFPNVSIDKIKILVATGRARLSEETFSSSEDSIDLRVLLIENNWSEYESLKSKYPVDNQVRERLLESGLSFEAKFVILTDIDTASVLSNTKLARVIADILVQIDSDLSDVNPQVIRFSILNSSKIDVSVSLLIKLIPFIDKKTCMEILEKMGHPYDEISKHGKRLRLRKTKNNFSLAKLLVRQNWISSLKEREDSIQINTFRYSVN